MHYNLKVINYPNGDIQIRQYSVPLRAKTPHDDYEENTVFEDWNTHSVNGNALCPFTGDMAKIVDDFKECSGSGDSNKIRNYNRTKQMIYTYGRCCVWEWFITLTFSGEKVDRYNYVDCSKKVRNWLNNQRKRYAPDLQYLLVPEQHKDGAWHFHGLLAQTGDMRFIDSGHKEKNGQVIYNMIKWQNGFTTATKVRDIHRVSKYIGKYITKSVFDLTVGAKRYYVSHNIDLPVSSVYLLEDSEMEDFIKEIARGSKKEIAHVSRTRADLQYTQVAYYELV